METARKIGGEVFFFSLDFMVFDRFYMYQTFILYSWDEQQILWQSESNKKVTFRYVILIIVQLKTSQWAFAVTSIHFLRTKMNWLIE